MKFPYSFSESANTATLTISQRRVRQISDPITQMLHILHKIIYISQVKLCLQLFGSHFTWSCRKFWNWHWKWIDSVVLYELMVQWQIYETWVSCVQNCNGSFAQSKFSNFFFEVTFCPVFLYNLDFIYHCWDVLGILGLHNSRAPL